MYKSSFDQQYYPKVTSKYWVDPRKGIYSVMPPTYTIGPNATVDQCKKMCEGKDDCSGFTMDTRTNTCVGDHPSSIISPLREGSDYYTYYPYYWDYSN